MSEDRIMKPQSIVNIGNMARIGRGQPLAFILGPCVIESEDSVYRHAESIARICRERSVSWVFKASYDKANRTSVDSFRGPGIEDGLRILGEVRRRFDVPVVTDVHSWQEAVLAAEVVDLLQVPAMLCRQTDLLLACGRSGKPVMVKKGQFMHPQDSSFIIDKLLSVGCDQIILCERGSCFGYRELVVDFRSLPIMRDTGAPVVFDATHSVQVMSGLSGRSGGDSRFVPILARAAVAVGVEAVFMEVHEDPSRALSDGSNMVKTSELGSLLDSLIALSAVSPCAQE